jgi:hypothetical protein
MHARSLMLTRAGSARRSLRFMAITVGPALLLSLAGAGRADGVEPTDLTPAIHAAATATAPSAAITPGTAASAIAARRQAGTWQLLPSSPVTERGITGPRAVWTGKETLVFWADFGDPQLSATRRIVTGVAYNPETRTWRKLPAFRSLKLKIYGRDDYLRVVWTGSEALVVGVVNGAYNPVTNRWRRIASSEHLNATLPVSVWTGRELLVWGGGGSASGAAYTPSTDTWRDLPGSPVRGWPDDDDGVWTGKELIVIYGSEKQVAAYNPTTRSWRRLAPMPTTLDWATVTWTGKEVLMVGGRVSWPGAPCACALAFDPATNRWRSLPDMEVGRTSHVAVWTGSRLMVWGGETVRGGKSVAPSRGVVFDPARNRWSPMPTSPLPGRTDPAAVWTGSRLIVWGGWAIKDDPEALFDGAAYTP